MSGGTEGPAIERETKLDAPSDFVLPELTGAVPDAHIEVRQPETLVASYFDTDDLRLARWGVSLRRRGGSWTVKLPIPAEGSLLTRREVEVEGGGPHRPPARARELVLAFARTRPLTPVAHLRTTRKGLVIASGGRPAIDVVDDRVAVLERGRVADRFRQIEVEVLPGGSADLAIEVAALISSAGAGRADERPKVGRALGEKAAEPPDVVPLEIGGGASVGDVVARAIAISVRRLIERDPFVRLADDPDALHRARVAVRRLHAHLRTFARVLDPTWRGELASELRWLIDVFGAPRDLDVLMARLGTGVPILPSATAESAAAMATALRDARERAGADMFAAMRSDRYVSLLDRLVEAARDPALVEGASASAREGLPSFVRAPWRELRAYEKKIGAHPSDRELHRLRIKTKRVRYAADTVAPIFGRGAREFAEAAADLQDALGDACDAIVARAWLSRWIAARTSTRVAPSGGDPGVVTDDPARRDDVWRSAWDRLSAKRLRSWM